MDLNSLLQNALKLTSEAQCMEDFPRMDRNFYQVIETIGEVHTRTVQTGPDVSRAETIVQQRGANLPRLPGTLNVSKTLEPLDPIAETDIQSFLKNEKENAILSIIEEVKKESYSTAQNQKWEHIITDWREEKIKLMNALIGPSQNWIDIRKGPEQTILNDYNFNRKSCLNSQEMAYAREVCSYNKLVMEEALRPNLIQKFAKVASEFNDIKINEMWKIMRYMVDVSPFPRNQDPLLARNDRSQFVNQAKRYLEERYKEYMSEVVFEHLSEAQRGGIPSKENLVKSFVALKFSQDYSSACIGLLDGSIEGLPLWPVVYYSLRCGDLQTAKKYVEFSGPGHADLLAALEEKCLKPDQHISSKHEMQIKIQYKRQIRNSTDSYRKAVYCVIGCCDINEQHPDIALTCDDFLWIQLSLIRSSDNIESLTYSGLQTMILETYGEKYFNATEKPMVYFQILILTGQFEAAIEFLSRFEKYRVHAVHIALALNELYMLGGARNILEPLLSADVEDTPPMRRLNLARLVMLYVKKFEITDPAESLQYFFFLRKLKDPKGKNLFLVCVSDLAIECHNYDLLFGKIQSNGIRSRGLLDQFESIGIDVKVACDLVADELIKKGMFENAIRMYDLAENYMQTLHYTSFLLSQVVHQSNKKGSLREKLQQIAKEFKSRYSGEDIQVDVQTRDNFDILITLSDFFDKYHDKNYQTALEILAETKLVPLNVSELDLCMQNFKRLGKEVTKVYPDLLIATMDILYNQYKLLKSKNIIEKEQKLSFLRDHAKAITNMAATLPYRMPGDTNNRLVQTEILMH